ncbi:hypothetical protein [Virgibacillus sediminis]|uniref:Uncharacterized protein n=1 Tax=Virgibacillus sediminis TaxID=202260 RepID=A0ABV7A6P6_9BACI
MKKKIIVSAMAGVVLTGCSNPAIVYKGEEMPTSEASERIADELEVENPGLDLEVSIQQETDE